MGRASPHHLKWKATIKMCSSIWIEMLFPLVYRKCWYSSWLFVSALLSFIHPWHDILQNLQAEGFDLEWNILSQSQTESANFVSLVLCLFGKLIPAAYLAVPQCFLMRLLWRRSTLLTSCDQSHVEMKCHKLDAVWSGYTLSGPTQSSHKRKKENNPGNMALL